MVCFEVSIKFWFQWCIAWPYLKYVYSDPILGAALGDGLPYMGIIKGFPDEFFEPPCRNVIVRTQLTQNGWSLSSTQICRKRHINDTKLPDYCIETSPLIYGANRWDDFYIMSTLEWNKLILTTTFPLYYFFLSWTNPLSPSVQPNQTYFSQKHKTQNANWKFSQQ